MCFIIFPINQFFLLPPLLVQCRLYWYRSPPLLVLLPPLLVQGRLYCYRGVTVLLPGWVSRKLMWFVHENLPLGWLSSVRTTTDSHWGRMAQFGNDYNPNTNSSILLQCKNKLQVHIKPTPTKQHPKQNIVCTTVLYVLYRISSSVLYVK